MAEIVGAFLRADLWDEGANSSIEGRNSSGSELAQERLELHLNRIKIRGVLWKVADYRPRFLNRLPNAGPQVDSAVIHHHDVIAPERGYQALLDICEEHLSRHGTLRSPSLQPHQIRADRSLIDKHQPACRLF